MEGGCLLVLGLGIGLRACGGGSMYETVVVGMKGVRLEGRIVQWLMIVEFVFRGSRVKARAVFKHDVSDKNVWTSQL